MGQVAAPAANSLHSGDALKLPGGFFLVVVELGGVVGGGGGLAGEVEWHVVTDDSGGVEGEGGIEEFRLLTFLELEGEGAENGVHEIATGGVGGGD